MESKNNVVKLSGTIMSDIDAAETIYGEQFYVFKLGVYRQSGVMDEVLCRVSERQPYFKELHQGGYISLEGRYISYTEKVNGYRYTTLSVFIEHFEIKEYVEGDEDINYAELNCSLAKIKRYRKLEKRVLCEITVVVERSFGKKDYIPCVLWGRNADFVNSEVKVGTKMLIKGRLQSRQKTKANKLGVETTYDNYELSVSFLQVLE